MELDRRTVLLVGLPVSLAGCVGYGDGPGDTGASPTATASPSSSGTTTATTEDLDLREANVTAVEFSREDGRVRFDVTLYHDDDGEEGYADWWQVETLDGERLGRRDLLHAHGTRQFTRSAEFEVPADVSCVVVRGHDQTHGYGGRAILVNLDSGETVTRRQSEEPRSFDATDCP
jgi:hypothetical protein